MTRLVGGLRLPGGVRLSVGSVGGVVELSASWAAGARTFSRRLTPHESRQLARLCYAAADYAEVEEGL